MLMIAAGPSVAAEQARTVILVRHAERAGGMAADVGLSEAGRCRAGALARMLADADIQKIFITEVARTQQTAQPLAETLKVRPEIVPAKDVEQLLAKLQTGGTALVVGHSNTIPQILEKLGAGTIKPIADDEFDRLFVVTGKDPSRVSLVTFHYAGCAQPHDPK